MLKVAVTGMGGQLALALQALMSDQVKMSFYARDEWDITDTDRTQKVLRSEHWDAVINTAAYTAVDLAESQASRAFEVNETGTAILGRCCAEEGIHLVHISSDYVYHNGLMRPLREGDRTAPQGAYAKSKLAGEQRLVDLGVPSTIIRTSWVYSPYGKNFVKTMYRLLQEKKKLRVVCDQHGSPTSAGDLAAMIVALLTWNIAPKSSGPNIINYAPKGWTTWYGMTKLIKNILDSDCEVIPIPSTEYPTPAKRPFNSILNCNKFDALGLGERMDWKVSLKETVREIRAARD